MIDQEQEQIPMDQMQEEPMGEPMEDTMEEPMEDTPEDMGEPKEVDAEAAALQKKADDYSTIMMKIMHSPETRDGVMEILSSSKDPYITVPQACMTVNDIAKQKIEQQSGKVDEATMLAASQYLVADVIELGVAAKKFGEPITESDKGELYQDALQMYVERGLKDGSIDPIELQLAGEKFMSTNQKTGGMYLAEQQGMGYEPSQGQMLQQFGKQRETSALARNAETQGKANKRAMDEKNQQASALKQGA